jgi:hypothetical protein
MESTAPAPLPRTVSGRWIVLTVFAFGIAATGGIWVYWKLHLAPFMPLQKALAAEFPQSSPRVDGGWSGKEFQQGPPRLRIVLRVPYPPLEQDARVPATLDRVIALARESLNLDHYETLEIYLVHYAPERAPRQFEFRARIRDLDSGRRAAATSDPATGQ